MSAPVKLQLFQASSLDSNFPCRHARFDGVCMQWFVSDRRDRRAPELFFSDYSADSDHGYADEWLQELFTEIEADLLASYIHGLALVREAVEFPTPTLWENGSGRLPLGAVPVGGNDDVYMMSREPEYSLPFDVWCYYRLDTGMCKAVSIDPCEHCKREHPPFVLQPKSEGPGHDLWLCDTCLEALRPEAAGKILPMYRETGEQLIGTIPPSFVVIDREFFRTSVYIPSQDQRRAS